MSGRVVACLTGAVLALITSFAGVSRGAVAAELRPGGTLAFGAEQKPVCLNVVLAECNLRWARIIAWTPVIRGAFIQEPDSGFREELVTRADVTTKPFSVTYHIQPEAEWSDQVPVTAADFVFTWKTLVSPRWDIADRTGYDLIARARTIGPKTVRFVFRRPFAAWKTIFASVLPAHVLKGRDFNKIWNERIADPSTGEPIGDGPFLVSTWTDDSLTLVRNPNYWGRHKAYLDRVIFKFVTNTNREIQAIEGQEVDAIYPQPQLALIGLRHRSGLRIQSNPGPSLEHIDFQLGQAGGRLGTAPWIRQAIAYSIDRSALVKHVFRALNPKLQPLQSLVYLFNQREYIPHFQKYKYDPARVASLMVAHGCETGSDGIWSCNGQRMSFSLASTKSKLRELALEIIRAQARRAGIELNPAFRTPGVLFTRVLPSGDFQLAMYGWVSPVDPQGWSSIYGCAGIVNATGYCNRKVTRLFNTARFQLDPRRRAASINAADAELSKGLPALPLYQRPTYLVYTRNVHGMRDNPTNAGPTWNAEDWWLE